MIQLPNFLKPGTDSLCQHGRLRGPRISFGEAQVPVTTQGLDVDGRKRTAVDPRQPVSRSQHRRTTKGDLNKLVILR